MPMHPMFSRMLMADRRAAERRLEIAQDRRAREAVQEAMARRAIYSDYGREVKATPIKPPKGA